jgi:hypothetical protein
MMHCSVCGAPLITKLNIDEIAKMGIECQFCYSTITRVVIRKALRIDEEEKVPLPEVKIKTKISQPKLIESSTIKSLVNPTPTTHSKAKSSTSSKKEILVKPLQSNLKKKRRSKRPVKKAARSKKHLSKKSIKATKSRKKKSRSSKK